ncbi:hypothetical protein GRI58_02270 [Porphyrobacter algicida]|uniref:Flagellar motor switch protein FliN-like C-terminal domain-containing protein n=1 Tax=Qipengyuania algicida TaxID=1836209 RepID=A0A845AGG3_9SPHN|nr:hypothetical protein [Qipengyuania algicida]
MKADFPLEAERAAAMHCEALLAHRLTDEDRLAKLGTVVGELARAMGERIARTTGLECSASAEAATLTASNAFQQAVNRPGTALQLIGLGDTGEKLTLAVFPQGLGTAVERLFGGRNAESKDNESTGGEVVVLRHSAVLLRQRIEQAFHEALAELLADTSLAPKAPRRQSASNLVLAVRQKVATCVVTIDNLGGEPVKLQIALREEAVGPILSAWRAKTRGSQGAGDCTADPWGTIALPVHAVLADTSIPLSRIGNLRAGDVLALPLRRQVPLMCQGRALAWGSVGEVDDCVALRITSLDKKGNLS